MANDIKIMSLRKDGDCECGTIVPQGTRAGWDRVRRVVICSGCLDTATAGQAATTPIELAPIELAPIELAPIELAPIELAPIEKAENARVVEVGVPGGSLQRTYDRRVAAREARVRRNFPRIGGLMLRLVPEPHTTKAFAIGAAGERQVAQRFERSLGDSVLFLYNRRLGTDSKLGDIDILAIAPSGVWIVDPKKYVGKKVRTDRDRSMFIVDGRRRPHLAESMARQVAVVTAAIQLAPVADVRVQAAYCFVGADLPLRALVVDGVPALHPRSTVRQLRKSGAIDSAQRSMLHAYLAEQFPSA